MVVRVVVLANTGSVSWNCRQPGLRTGSRSWKSCASFLMPCSSCQGTEQVLSESMKILMYARPEIERIIHGISI